ncbi:MAG: RICIN domain-containing protein [Ruminococcus sp.]|nr:RICIN domain-containing protein [Ruminococcus sp.]
MSICGGVAGRRGRNPVGIFIHNDAGSPNANAAFYRSWLQTHPLENGFAHYYVAADGILQAEDDANCAWHCGNLDGNLNYLSIEVCQSMGDINIFKDNEEKVLALAAQKCKQFGITPSNSTIRLHREVFATSCPHRSVEVHGGAAATKAYFINRISELMIGAAISTQSSSRVEMRDQTGTDNQRFYIEDAGNDYVRLKNKKTGLYLNVPAGEAKNDAVLQLYEKNNTDAQLWKIIYKSHGHAQYTLLEPKLAPGKYVSVENNGINGGVKVKLWDDLKSSKQKFWTKQADDGSYVFVHVYSLKAITAV